MTVGSGLNTVCGRSEYLIYEVVTGCNVSPLNQQITSKPKALRSLPISHMPTGH